MWDFIHGKECFILVKKRKARDRSFEKNGFIEKCNDQIQWKNDYIYCSTDRKGTEGKAGMAAIHVDLSGIVATGETGLGGCGDVSYPDLDNLVSQMIRLQLFCK